MQVMVWRVRLPSEQIHHRNEITQACPTDGATNCRPTSSTSWRDKLLAFNGFAVRFSRNAIFFISEVALLWKKDYLRKTTCDWLCGYDAAFVKLLYPLVVLGLDNHRGQALNGMLCCNGRWTIRIGLPRCLLYTSDAADE